ncbi:Disulphide bond corrector protein DsbC [Palleronia salina]|uniref:Disulphide bond corrector protein DsbC n=1 Tax=Palleronia salina TaxID=313368 RepID=A0A1M6EKT5_9RHOB|nr:protein-disulfide reductase DsbD domain-containing protein [Palleronia salina]SHI85898.1 Disulphide bond corrector protein DsbC [Palleronia salina]
MFRLVALLILLAAPLRAEMAQVSLLPGWRDGGSHTAALQINLAPGWKTYWRAPGEAGIPPSFNWSGSTNLAGVRVVWPVPHVFDQNGMRSVGYDVGLTLPLIVEPRDPRAPVELRLNLDMGVCRDVCVPVSAQLSGTLPAASARADARIRAALSDRPVPGRKAGAGPLDCRLTPTDRGLRVDARLRLPAMGGDEHGVIEPGDPRFWVADSVTRRDGNMLHVSSEVFAPRGMALGLDRGALRLTVLGQSGAVEINGCD